jgi:hypothetical protein
MLKARDGSNLIAWLLHWPRRAVQFQFAALLGKLGLASGVIINENATRLVTGEQWEAVGTVASRTRVCKCYQRGCPGCATGLEYLTWVEIPGHNTMLIAFPIPLELGQKVRCELKPDGRSEVLYESESKPVAPENAVETSNPKPSNPTYQSTA